MSKTTTVTLSEAETRVAIEAIDGFATNGNSVVAKLMAANSVDLSAEEIEMMIEALTAYGEIAGGSGDAIIQKLEKALN
jgi:hypothetical protein